MTPDTDDLSAFLTSDEVVDWRDGAVQSQAHAIVRGLSDDVEMDQGRSTGHTNGVNAQFSLEEEQLAFSMVPDEGEYIYNSIYNSPAPEVVSV